MAKIIFAMMVTVAGLICLGTMSRAETGNEVAAEKMLAQLSGSELNEVIDACIREIKAIDEHELVAPQTTAQLPESVIK